MLNVSAKKVSDAKAKSQTLVLFAHKSGATSTIPGLNKTELGKVHEITGKELEFDDLKKGLFLRGHNLNGYTNLALIAVSPSKDDSFSEGFRKLGALVLQLGLANKQESMAIDLESLCKGQKKLDEVCQALTEGLCLADYRYDEFITKDKKKNSVRPENIVLVHSTKMNSKTITEGIRSGSILAECVNFSRGLGDAPGNIITPVALANETVKAARGTGLKVTVWDKARIKKEKMGGLFGVNLGGGPDCRFIIMEYNGAGKSKKPVAFVGKGLTFDSGGISIKPSQGMEEMKYDMCGGANVIGTLLAIAKLKLKVNVIGLVPSTENMPGPMANKPGDILVARNGKSVEVFNTDAEGRLILMDALSYASEKKPRVIFDAATLTGAVVVALGNSYTGVFTRDKKLMKDIQDAADKSGEWVWPMPINDHHVADMKGTHADLCNISSFKGAGSSTAAAFLEQFVDKDIPWAHFDIAGTAWHIGGRVNYSPKKGASGVMIRTFVELAKKFG